MAMKINKVSTGVKTFDPWLQLTFNWRDKEIKQLLESGKIFQRKSIGYQNKLITSWTSMFTEAETRNTTNYNILVHNVINLLCYEQEQTSENIFIRTKYKTESFGKNGDKGKFPHKERAT